MSEEDEQYRVKNGYGKLIEYLANKCSAKWMHHQAVVRTVTRSSMAGKIL